MFCVNRFEMNKGTGVESGKWVFNPFMFADALFGRATVGYDVRFNRVPTIESVHITELVIVDDDGNDLDMELPDGVLHDLRMCVFTAFREQRVSVLDFEMGLL